MVFAVDQFFIHGGHVVSAVAMYLHTGGCVPCCCLVVDVLYAVTMSLHCWLCHIYAADTCGSLWRPILHPSVCVYVCVCTCACVCAIGVVYVYLYGVCVTLSRKRWKISRSGKMEKSKLEKRKNENQGQLETEQNTPALKQQ